MRCGICLLLFGLFDVDHSFRVMLPRRARSLAASWTRRARSAPQRAARSATIAH